MDFWTYWWHVMNHKIPFFWRFHQVHHSDREMDVTTASRFHIGEFFFSSVLRTGIILLTGVTLWEILLYEVFLNIVIQFHHANIGLPNWLDKLLRIFIVTPAMHKVHHSDYQQETDSNFTSLFSWWDRVFGTFHLRKNPKEIQFGLKSVESKKSRKIGEIIKLPFKK
jgi:sterol desaturase/sphingolipid hydroxylase (fatty acid hydroxylase superfamily)